MGNDAVVGASQYCMCACVTYNINGDVTNYML
jgi:hypothetical protein